jgi:hypothetical protein
MSRSIFLLAAAFSASLACAPGDFLSGGDGSEGDAAVEGGDDGGDDGGDESNDNDYPAAGGYGMDLGSGYPTAGDGTAEPDNDAGALFDAATSG